jgi:hypothetical protein
MHRNSELRGAERGDEAALPEPQAVLVDGDAWRGGGRGRVAP